MIQGLKSRVNLKLSSGFIWWAVIILGVVLRLRQYFADRSLWSDEAALALNIVGRSFTGLIQPLDFEQGAPLGFLFIEKTILLILGNKDYILRLFPLLSGLLSIYFLYRICREYYGISGLFALSFFAVSWTLIYYSNELKQYSSDVLISTGLVYLAFRALRKDAGRKEILILGAAGAVTVWISHPAIFILASIGLVLAIENLSRKALSKLIWILGIGVVWIVDLGLAYLVSLRNLMDNSYLSNFWRPFFMPLPPWRHWDWFGGTYVQLLDIANHVGSVPSRPFILVSSLLLVIGVGWFFIFDRSIALMMAFPFVFVLLAAALQKYPFGERFILFLLPFLFLFMAKGLEQIYFVVARWNRTASLVICGVAVLVTLWPSASTSFRFFLSPYMREHIRPALAYMSQNTQFGDVIYVYYESQLAFEYYAPSLNFKDDKIIYGAAGSADSPVDIGNINQLRGNRRVWLVFSSYCSQCETARAPGQYLQRLNKIGKEIDYSRFPGASLFLYDFSQ